ncbi:transcription factor zinc-finger [Leptospira ryugenii]|uniref:Transcription factor zinc-finger n=1 Tax=Leptospira ryugenii TaxID=1917863 RepID=A0A2P2E5E8_9LEPT|nr:zf-TFIIB domain-containing protein [Leptospira ryugenii]GBF52108.1 transcription factor zinc-finger [Leptospira ryugenii]
MICSTCKTKLHNLKTEFGYFWICQDCYGHFFSEKNILKYIPKIEWDKIKSKSKKIKKQRVINCPSCKNQMQILILPESKNNLEIDLCQTCQIIWFDKDEIEDLELKQIVSENLNKLGKNAYDLSEKKNVVISEEAKIQYLLANIKLDNYLKQLKRKEIQLDRLNRTPSGILSPYELASFLYEINFDSDMDNSW